MTNLTRVTGKTFGETATATGDDPEIGQFGSAKAGTYIGTTDIATIQSLPAWSNGFVDSVTPNTQFPPLPEVTGALKVLSHQENYILQKGVAEWDSGTTYYTGDFCKGVGEGKLYVSKADSNINHAVTDGDYWEEFSSGASRNIGEIVSSTIPLTDAGLHLLDGALISGSGSYAEFVEYIADLYDSGDYTAIFETEANWQAAVTLSGVCDKFVYDSVNNTVRLPKYGSQIFTKSSTIASTVPVKGNGKALGLTDGNGHNYGYAVVSGQINADTSAYNKTLPQVRTTNYPTSTYVSGITTNGSKSGIVADLSSGITNYPLDCYYYIVIATTTKTAIEVDIDEIATDLNGKMDTDGTNALSSVKFADGQWVSSRLDIAQSVTQNTTVDDEYDISTYLPNDLYNYEVLISANVTTGTSSGNMSTIVLTTDILSDGIEVCRAITRTSSNMQDGSSAILLVGASRTITKLLRADGTGKYSLFLLAYRRIGTNQ